MLPPIHVMPFIGCNALYKIAALDPPAGDPFGTSKKGRDIYHPLASAPIDEVFGDVAPQEAMFVCYRRRDNGPLPRLTKACEGRIDLVADYCAFDVDLNVQFGEKGKLSWARLGEERTLIMQARIDLVLSILAEHDAAPVCWYRSKNGLRFVHLFHSEVTVAGLEAALARIAGIYKLAEIIVDAACFDWTRCFKVPRCTLEDGTVTDTQPWFQIEWFPEAVTLVTAEELAAQPRSGFAGEVSTEARLEVSHAREMVERDGKLTPEGLAASHQIRSDAELQGVCFGKAPIVEHRGDGKTHTTLTRLIGRLTKKCVGYEWATEQFLYALIAHKVAELGDDEPWLDKAWGMVCDYLASDRQELAERNAEVQAEVEEKAAPPPPSALQVFCDGIRSWFPDAVGQDDDSVVEMVKAASLGIAVGQHSNDAFVLQPNGFYTPYPVSPEKMALKIRESEMEWLIPTEIEVTDKKGQTRLSPRSWPHFLAEDARTFATTRMLCVHRGNYLGKDEAGNTQLVISPFWLRDLEPKFNQQVETWLQLAAEDGESENLVLALAYLLAFKHGPTAALALIGPRSVGKKLIATGLAECINTLQVCPGRVLISRFNAGLTKSPIIWIDEGIPKGKDGIDFADEFRNIVTGGKKTVEPKGKEPFEVAGVHRVLITANNYEAIAALGEDAPRTQDDLDAISERLAVFKLQKRAADYLGRIDTRGWIAGDNGSPSQFVIARHLLWHLFNTVQWEDGQPKKRGRRLLYEGRIDGLVQQTIDAADENVPEVAVVMNDMVRAGQATLRDDVVYVPPDQLKHKLCGPGKQMKPSQYRRAVSALSFDSHNTTINNVSARWHLVAIDRLAGIVSQITTLAPQLLTALASKEGSKS